MRTFEYRYTRFVFDQGEGRFNECNVYLTILESDAPGEGLDEEARRFREAIFGQNTLNIDRKPWHRLLVDEILHPFYIFQVFSIILWCTETYYYYAACIFVMSLFSILTTLLETQHNLNRLRHMTNCESFVQCLRDGTWDSMSSARLVPGDVIQLSGETEFLSCDAALLSGEALFNESILTGESIPVAKSGVPLDDYSAHLFDRKHAMYAGTHLMKVRSAAGRMALAVVTKTGFSTVKGRLIRSILFPRPNKFKFYRDSFYFIGVLSLLGKPVLLSACDQLIFSVGVGGFIYAAYILLENGVSFVGSV